MVAQLVSRFSHLYEIPKCMAVFASPPTPAVPHCLAQFMHLSFLPSAPKCLEICSFRFIVQIFFCNERKRLSVSGRSLRVFGPMASRRQSVAAVTCCRPSVSLPQERWESPDVPTCCFPFKGDALRRLNVASCSVLKCCHRASVCRRAVEQCRDGCGTVHHLHCDCGRYTWHAGTAHEL